MSQRVKGVNQTPAHIQSLFFPPKRRELKAQSVSLSMGMAAEAEQQKEELVGLPAGEEDDEHDSKEAVLQKYFLLEWKLVKSLLDDIVSNGCVSDPSVAHKIRSIVM